MKVHSLPGSADECALRFLETTNPCSPNFWTASTIVSSHAFDRNPGGDDLVSILEGTMNFAWQSKLALGPLQKFRVNFTFLSRLSHIRPQNLGVEHARN